MPVFGAKVVLLRHGQSEANARSRVQGSSDSPLTDLGRDQARRSGRRLRDDVGAAGFAGAFSSDTARTRQTLDIVLEEAGLSGPREELPLMRERRMGAGEGRTAAEFAAMAENAGYDPQHFTPRGAETTDQVMERCWRFMNRMRRDVRRAVRQGGDGAHVIYCGHAYMFERLCVLLRNSGVFFPATVDGTYAPNCGMTVLDVRYDTETGAMPINDVEVYNDDSHLAPSLVEAVWAALF